METKFGVIKSIEKKNGTGAKGAWTKYAFTMEDGKVYSTFDAVIGENFKPGQSVSMTGEQSGQYWNMKTMSISQNSPVSASNSGVSEVIKGIIISRTENANSYEFGKAGNRHKVFYETAEDLKAKMKALAEAGFIEEDFNAQTIDETKVEI